MTDQTGTNLTFTMQRTFTAPRALVFRAHTDPALIPRWWGPRGYTTVIAELDLRPGGRWRFVQTATDGSVHAFRGEYREIVPPERLVNTFEYEGMPGHIIVEETTFTEQDGVTTLTAVSRFATAEDRDWMISTGMESGANESYGRLAELLATLA